MYLLCALVGLLLTVQEGFVCSQLGVFIEFKGNRLNSSSVVLLTDIGEQPAGPTSEPDTVRGDALVCVTDFPTCCRVADGSAGTTGVGRWLFPGGDEVPGIGGSVPHMGIYRNRGTSLVRLNRQADSPQMTAGEYCCEIPDRFGDTQNVCVNVDVPINMSTTTPIATSSTTGFVTTEASATSFFTSSTMSLTATSSTTTPTATSSTTSPTATSSTTSPTATSSTMSPTAISSTMSPTATSSTTSLTATSSTTSPTATSSTTSPTATSSAMSPTALTTTELPSEPLPLAANNTLLGLVIVFGVVVVFLFVALIIALYCIFRISRRRSSTARMNLSNLETVQYRKGRTDYAIEDHLTVKKNLSYIEVNRPEQEAIPEYEDVDDFLGTNSPRGATIQNEGFRQESSDVTEHSADLSRGLDTTYEYIRVPQEVAVVSAQDNDYITVIP